MDLMQSEDQDAIQDAVRTFLEGELPSSKIRALFDQESIDGLDTIWRSAGELGFFGLAVAEDQGGAGFALTEEMVLFNELGRALAPGPWLGSVLGARAIEDPTLRASILSGDRPCAFAQVGGDDSIEVSPTTVSGTLAQVADVEWSQGLLLDEGERWLLVDRDPSWSVIRLESLDPTRRLFRLDLNGAACREVAAGEEAARLRRVATVLLCAEAVGGIQRTVDMSVEYCKVRTQFDKPIGSFQAVKHRCADMAARAEVARAATIYAAVCVRDRLEDEERQVAVAKLLCADAYLQNSADNIQNHGGMGFTWECDAHLYMKRAHGFEQTLGSRAQHLDSLVAELRAR